MEEEATSSEVLGTVMSPTGRRSSRLFKPETDQKSSPNQEPKVEEEASEEMPPPPAFVTMTTLKCAPKAEVVTDIDVPSTPMDSGKPSIPETPATISFEKAM